MKVYLATDHAGFEIKEGIASYLKEAGHEVIDMGAHAYVTDDDYPDFIGPCAQDVAANLGSFGIVFGGSGHGEAMVANRTQGVRAATFYGPHKERGYEIVMLAREHNDANILSVGAQFVTLEEATEAVRIFLETPFSEDERHLRRLGKF